MNAATVRCRPTLTPGLPVEQLTPALYNSPMTTDNTSHQTPGPSSESDLGNFQTLVDIVARLRAPGGCPWDREQTHASLKRNLLEECYEALEAIDQASPPLLAEELGDLLVQIAFHADIAREAGEFTLADVLTGINGKLIRRHPHVFGERQRYRRAGGRTKLGADKGGGTGAARRPQVAGGRHPRGFARPQLRPTDAGPGGPDGF